MIRANYGGESQSGHVKNFIITALFYRFDGHAITIVLKRGGGDIGSLGGLIPAVMAKACRLPIVTKSIGRASATLSRSRYKGTSLIEILVPIEGVAGKTAFRLLGIRQGDIDI